MASKAKVIRVVKVFNLSNEGRLYQDYCSSEEPCCMSPDTNGEPTPTIDYASKMVIIKLGSMLLDLFLCDKHVKDLEKELGIELKAENER